MATTVVVSGINPNLNILGNYQKFVFPETDQWSVIGAISSFSPLAYVPSYLIFEFLNKTFAGYRFLHTTSLGETFGEFSLEKYNQGVSAAPIFSYTGSIDILDFKTPVAFAETVDFNSKALQRVGAPITSTDGANKQYVDAAIGAKADPYLIVNRYGSNSYPLDPVFLNSFNRMESATPVTITANDHFNIGYGAIFEQSGDGQIEFVPATGFVINSVGGSLKTRTKFSTVTILRTSVVEYSLFGDLEWGFW